MKTILASALALGLMTSAAVARPVALGDAQLDQIKAGEAIAVVVECINGSCQTVESRGPVAIVRCVNGVCEVVRCRR